MRAIREAEKKKREAKAQQEMQKELAPEPFKLRRFRSARSRIADQVRPLYSVASRNMFPFNGIATAFVVSFSWHAHLQMGRSPRGPRGGSPGGGPRVVRHEDPRDSDSPPRVRQHSPRKESGTFGMSPRVRRPGDGSDHSPRPSCYTTARASHFMFFPTWQNLERRDHIRENVASASGLGPRRRSPRERGSGVHRHKEYGQVPLYLQERKQLEAERAARARRRQGDPDAPPGMRRLPEGERRETLAMLQERADEVRSELSHFPISVDVPKVRRKKEVLDTKLAELEDAIEVFSRDAVYVDIDPEEIAREEEAEEVAREAAPKPPAAAAAAAVGQRSRRGNQSKRPAVSGGRSSRKTGTNPKPAPKPIHQVPSGPRIVQVDPDAT